jgi:hypothetical protein
LAWMGIPAAVMVAGYTAFLFGQAEGRDLWQSPGLFWHLQPQAVLAGAGALLLFPGWPATAAGTPRDIAWALALASLAHLLVVLVELSRKHTTRNAEVAAHAIVRGRYARMFWAGIAATALSGGVALAVALGAPVGIGVLAGLVAQAGLLAYESVFVRAAQDVPLS